MWDQNVLNQLIDWLNEEGRQLRKNKNYDGYKLLSDAASEIANWLGTQIPQETETRLYALIGAERLNRFLSERNIEIGQVAPSQTDVLAGSKSESVGQTTEPDLQPSGDASSASSVSSVPNIDPAGSPRPVRGPAVESENGEDPLLARLREVKNRKGEITLERLADYLKDLGQAAQDWKNKHPGASTEANEALSIVQDGQNLLDQVARKTQIEADFAKAEASRNLRAARALLQDVDTILKKAQGSLGLFGTAAAAAEREFDGVHKDLETRRAKVTANLGKYLTIGVSNLAKRLDELDELIQNNVPYVPDDKGGEQATTSVFRETRVMFIEKSIEKANELKISIKAALGASTDQFDSAARDCETVLSWFESKHIKDQFANDPLVLDLKNLSSKIEDLKKQREATARWLELASSMDGVEALTQWDARILYPKLEPDITQKRGLIIQTLVSDLRSEFELAKSDALNEQDKRSYEKARERFAGVNGKIKRLLTITKRQMLQSAPVEGMTDAKLLELRRKIEQGFSSEIQALETDLKIEFAAIQAQQRLWNNFEEKRQSVLTQLNEGNVDAQAKQIIEAKFTTDEKKIFEEEWKTLWNKVEQQGDQTRIIQDAEELFENDPSDVRIEETLVNPQNKGLLVTETVLRPLAEGLLNRHRAYRSRLECLNVFDEVDLIQDTSKAWLERVSRKIENLKQRAKTAKLDELLTEAAQIERAARRISTVWVEIRPMLTERFVEARLSLDRFDTASNDAQSQEYEQRGSANLHRKLNHIWRLARWEKIVSLLDQRHGQQLPDIDKVDQVMGYAQELFNAKLLTEDGDMPIYKDLENLWHQCHAEQIFSKSLDQAKLMDLDQLAKTRHVNWQDLLSHLDPLSSRSSDIANLTAVARAHWAAELPAERGVQELEVLLKNAGTIKERLVVYPAMVMILVQMGDYDRARKIGQQLKGFGIRVQNLAQAVEKILEAADAYQQNKLKPALATFEVAINNLQKDYADFSTGWDLLKDATTLQWRTVLGKGYLEQVKNFNPLHASTIDLFSTLEKLLVASEYLNDPSVISEQAERLSIRINESIPALESSIEAYLDRPGQMLQKALESGRLYYAQLKILRMVNSDPSVKKWISHLPDRLEQKISDLGDLVRDSEKEGAVSLPVGTLNRAWKVINRVRNDIKNKFLPGEWFWNKIVEETPLQDLKDYKLQCEQERRETEKYTLRFQEIEHLRGWVVAFERATGEISNKLKLVTENFPDNFEDGLSALNELEASLRRNELELARYPHALGELPEPIDLERHIRIISTLSFYEFKNGRWFRTGGAAREFNKIDEVNKLIGLLKKNFERWKGFTSSIIELLDGDSDRQCDGIYMRLNRARQDLRNGKADKSFKALTNEIPAFVEQFKTKKRELKNMEPPLTTAAIDQALRFPDFDLLEKLHGDPEKFSAGKTKISNAKPEEMGTAWDEYLDLHIQFQEDMLIGDAIKIHFESEGLQLVEGAKEIDLKMRLNLRGVYRGKDQESIKFGVSILKRELGVDENTLNQFVMNIQKQPTNTSYPLILDCCIRKMILEVQKEALKVQLNSWKNVTEANQKMYLELIEKAERIDKEDEVIKNHRVKWEQRGNVGEGK